MNDSKKTTQPEPKHIPTTPENTKAILSRRDFLIQSLLITGASGILVESACVCLEPTPDCIAIDSVDMVITAKWFTQNSEFVIETSVNTPNAYGVNFHAATSSDAMMVGNQQITYDTITFVCKPNSGVTQIEVKSQVTCSATMPWNANFTLVLDVTDPEVNKQLTVVSQKLEGV